MFSEFTYIRTAFLFCTATLLAFVSCDGFINEDYDLSKDIDMTVSGLQGADVPLGNFKEISVADLFGFGSGDKGVVYPDYDGNYILEHTVKGELSVPSPDIDLTSLQFRDLFDPIESRMYKTPMRLEPIWVARRIRCASPPESDPALRERVR